MNAPSVASNNVPPPCARPAPSLIQKPRRQIDVFDFSIFEFRQVGDFLIPALHHQPHAVGDERLQDVVALV